MSWNFAYTPQIWPSVFTVLLLIALAIYSWHRRSAPGVLPFTCALLFSALWAGGSFLEYLAVDLAAKIVWVKFQAVWQLPGAIAVTCFLLEYTWPGRWLTRRNLILLSFVPLLVVLFILTNDLHYLMWSGFEFNGKVSPLLGPAGWIGVACGYSLVIVNFIVLAWLFLHSPQHRWFVVLILGTQVIFRVLYLVDITRGLRSDLPLDVFGIAFAYLMYGIALFRFHILNPVPLARQMVIDQMREGMLVVDRQGRVASLNPAAVTFLGLAEEQACGRPLQEVLPSFPPVQDGGLSEAEISLGTGPGARAYLLAASSLKDWRGQEAGCLLLLHDVTEQRRSQAQFLEQQRALAMLQEREQLARELHDGIGQVFGYVKMQTSATRDLLAQGQNETADSQLAQLEAVAQDAHANVREYILGAKIGESTPFGFLPNLRGYLQRFSEQYLLRNELSAPPEWSDDMLEASVAAQVLRIVQEALSNARKHALAQCVQVHLEMEDSRTRVVVQDDGVGFDPDFLKEGQSDHYGLQFMRERAEQIGGCLAIESQPGMGTRVIIEVPVTHS